jgi:hypothetical protein
LRIWLTGFCLNTICWLINARQDFFHVPKEEEDEAEMS